MQHSTNKGIYPQIDRRYVLLNQLIDNNKLSNLNFTCNLYLKNMRF